MSHAASSSRDTAFDAVKGVLVVLMVVYHVLSIASTAGEEAFRYIRFVSGSFIFISGFVVTRFMFARFAAAPAEVARRLIWRGAKVLLIFTVLNLAIHVSGFGNVGKQNLGVEGFVRHAATIYLVGDGRLSSFLILLPIAYLLMLAPAYLALAVRAPLGTAAVAAGLVLTLGLPPIAATLPPTLEFLLVGFFGLALGTPVLAQRLVGNAPPGRLATAIGLPLSIVLTGAFGGPLALYCVGVAFVLRFIHDIVCLAPPGSRAVAQAVLLGRYALMSYIGQIVLIQLCLRLLLGGSRSATGAGILLLMIGVATGCWTAAMALERTRHRSRIVDRTYRWVFA